jgi:hypothetical protein
MTAHNVDAMEWPLDTSVRIALFVPTTADGIQALGSARTIYYCPRDHGAIEGIDFELYALIEDWVDPLRLARFMHNSYVSKTLENVATTPLLRASLPAGWAASLKPEELFVGVEECENESAPQHVPVHPLLDVPEETSRPADHTEDVDADAANPLLSAVGRTTRLVRIRMQNHHVLQFLVWRLQRWDEIELTIQQGTKRSALFALLYMHYPSRQAAPAAAAAEAAAAQRRKPVLAGKASKNDSADMFRGSSAQRVLSWDTTVTGQVIAFASQPAAAKDTERLEKRRLIKEAEKRAHDKAASKKKKGNSNSTGKKRKSASDLELPHLRLARTTTVQAIFLQHMHHIKIDAFVHEHERELADRTAKAIAQARIATASYRDLDAPAPVLSDLDKVTTHSQRVAEAKTISFTAASMLVVHVPAGTARYVSGRLTPGPVQIPFKMEPDDVKRAFGTRPPLISNDVVDPNCVHWLVDIADVEFARELGGLRRGIKRTRDETPTVSVPPPRLIVVHSPIEELIDMGLMDDL